MKQFINKSGIGIALMLLALYFSLNSPDVIKGNLLAALSIALGAFSFHSLATQNDKNYKQE
ncbi:hypothetical protein QWY31_10870 [Cytophagales bacterium LB-30]|uniref:Uncharacterized protein n=1 Tax=Shiella aurantiaca TaxID=3058365 RepID=A0ABT8F6B0_9BACT|nr:hypothetical protein [Shiella aurantiaca]MDN4166006.1 hypothetical protein [Shiella aurantiaca]